MAGVLVFGEAVAGILTPASLEAATAGAELAAAVGQPLSGGLIGRNIGDAVAAFLGGGMSTLYIVDDLQFEPYIGERYAGAATAVIEHVAPSVVLFPHSLNTREWGSQLAARLQTHLVTDCVRLDVDGADVVLTKPIYGGGILAEYVVASTPVMATLRPGAFAASTPGAQGHIVPLDIPFIPARVTVLDETIDEPPSGPTLRDAKIVVSGGLGVGGRENWRLIEDVAEALGAAVGATRAVTDLGWAPTSQQVGLTGASVAPDLYIAIGISGAVQHLAGIGRAKTVVAINRDPEAPIFTRARYGAIGDAREIVPAFVERLRELRA